MRYRMLATYRGVPYEAGVGPAGADVVLFAACPPPEELGFEPATGHWRKKVIRAEVDALWESRPVGTFGGEPCIVLDDLGDRLHIAYLGSNPRNASRLGYWQIDRGVYELLTPREDVTGLTEERVERPLRTAPPLAGSDSEPGPGAGPADVLGPPDLPVRDAPLSPAAPGLPTAPDLLTAPASSDLPGVPASGTGLPSQSGLPSRSAPPLPDLPARPDAAAPPAQAGLGPPPAAPTWPSLEPAQPEVAEREVAEPEPVRPGPVQPEPSLPKRSRPEPGLTEPALPGTASLEPGAPGRERPEPAGPGLTSADPALADPALPEPSLPDRPLPEPSLLAAAGHGGSEQSAPEPGLDLTQPLAARRSHPLAPPAPPQPAQFAAGQPEAAQPYSEHPGPPPAPPAAGQQAAQPAPPPPAASAAPHDQHLPAPPAYVPAAPGQQLPAPLSQHVQDEHGPTQHVPAQRESASQEMPRLDATQPAPARHESAQAGRRPRAAENGSRASRRQRVATRDVFCELADLAGIPRAAYALEAEVDGVLCLLATATGYDVFVSADGARHEVRSFPDEEAAYFYLFGVLVAEAIRNGALTPAATHDSPV